MLVPNKTSPLNNTILYKSIEILNAEKSDLLLTELYKNNKRKFSDVGEFILALDLLFVLDEININFNTGMVSYVNKN